MKRLRDARHPMSFCTPFRFQIGAMLVMAEIFSGLASMSRSETMNPRSMPRGTPKMHFSGFSLIFFSLRKQNATSRSATRSLAVLDLTTISSMYASMVHPIRSPKTLSMHRWYMAPVFLRPNGMIT
jgi:hypothetical protein